MTQTEVSSQKAEKTFPLEGKVEVKDGKPVYTFSTTVKWDGGERTFEIHPRGPLSGVQQAERLHKKVIEAALAEGKSVPPEALEYYPDLQKGKSQSVPAVQAAVKSQPKTSVDQIKQQVIDNWGKAHIEMVKRGDPLPEGFFADHPELEKYASPSQIAATEKKSPEYVNNGFGPKRTIAPPEDAEAIKSRIAELEAKKAIPPKAQTNTQLEGPRTAEKFRALADRLDAQIEDKKRPMTQNPTPKRMAEYRSRYIDGEEMERTQKALRALADAHEAGNVPPELAGLRSKEDIGKLVYKGLDTSKGGYYDRIPRQEYRDTSPAGKKLQEMIEGAKSPEATAARLAKEKASKISQLEADVQFSNFPGYFPTPKPIAEKLVQAANIRSGMSVLEPSAGKGNIADVIRENAPDAKLSVVEQATRLQDILKLKDHSLVDSDFLEHGDHYDRIVMNPPFEKNADIAHVRHAYDLLKPGGRLVAVMSPHAEFASDKVSTQFRDWLEEVGGSSEKLPESSFKESGTGAGSRMVVIDKP